MKSLSIYSNLQVKTVFDNYSVSARPKIENLRRIIFETANEIDELHELEETLKWREPSYIAKKGSTIRIDWKPKSPDQYAMYFSCSSSLVETFKQVYGNLFNYEGKRAIIFELNDDIPEKELKSCIRAALTYHKVKNIDKLGM